MMIREIASEAIHFSDDVLEQTMIKIPVAFASIGILKLKLVKDIDVDYTPIARLNLTILTSLRQEVSYIHILITPAHVHIPPTDCIHKYIRSFKVYNRTYYAFQMISFTNKLDNFFTTSI